MKICHCCKRHVRDSDRQCPFCGTGVPTTTALMLAFSLGLASTVIGCGPAVDSGGSTGSADGTAGSEGSGMAVTSMGSPSVTVSTTATVSSADTGFDPDTTAADATTFATSTGGTESSSEGGFIEDPDGGGGVYGVECSVWDQDCPAGEKCVPWANDGGNALNATRCNPLDPMPVADGEPCLVEPPGVTGIDNCGPESHCFDVDPDTLVGACVGFCDGSEAAPVCAVDGQECVIENWGAISFCLDTCDPFGEPCSNDRSCVAATPEQFVCARPGTAALGENCLQFVDCEPGASCVELADNERVCVPPCQPAGDPCEAGSTCQPWGDAGVCVPSP